MSSLRTALHAWHTTHQGRIVPFGGWEMPVQYAGVLAEHHAVRTSVGLFDVSHMGRLYFDGENAIDWLDKISTNSVRNMKTGQIRYSLLCNEAGGIIDDVLIYRWPDRWGMVVNAGNRLEVIRRISEFAPANSSLVDDTLSTSMLAVQGPFAVACCEKVLATPAKHLKYYFGETNEYAGKPCRVSRTGYTGEDGLEIVVPAELSLKLADDLIVAGATPTGLGARDTLRLEAGMPLYGHELSETIDPFQAGLGWAVKLEGREFVGRDSLLKRQNNAALPVRVGLRSESRRAPREGCLVVSDGNEIGRVTSGSYSPTLAASIAMAYIPRPFAAAKTQVQIDIRGTVLNAEVVELPFYRRS